MEDDFAYNVKTDKLAEEWKAEAEYLLSYKEKILKTLAEKGMHEDVTTPYTYYIPIDLSFDCGKEMPMHAIYAIVLMARASYAVASFLDVDAEGYPELPEFCGGEDGFQRVYITDPFAQHIDAVIQRHWAKLLAEGQARNVNGKFFKVA